MHTISPVGMYPHPWNAKIATSECDKNRCRLLPLHPRDHIPARSIRIHCYFPLLMSILSLPICMYAYIHTNNIVIHIPIHPHHTFLVPPIHVHCDSMIAFLDVVPLPAKLCWFHGGTHGMDGMVHWRWIVAGEPTTVGIYRYIMGISWYITGIWDLGPLDNL
jgi:hypothetical protein